MKLRRFISFLLVAMLMASVVSVAASAQNADLAQTGYYNQTYLENYATAAYNETGLGCTYTPASTTFKVWAPEATGVNVKLYATGTDAESGAAVLGAKAMTYNKTTGIWSLTLSGDHKNEYYTYVVDRGGVIKETQDPYATAVGANGDRSMICDLDSTDPDGWADDKHVFFDNPGEAVVWEIHVRDFSIDVSSGVSDANKGKYLAFTEGNTTVGGKGKVASCVDYLVEHNVNCVQLMPIEDFASIDETDEAIRRNWGYDPKNYNVPEGSYSSDPYDGNTRIKEFKMLVQALHDRGIAVVMDVVYNHTFVLEGSSLNLTTPNYYYRKSSAENYVNGSGLGNVLASEKKMCSKFISDSLCYWVNEYHIDGFRFDLMGCHDVPNMKTWRANLDKIDKRVLMYGEPWGGTGEQGIGNAISNANLSQISRVGAFNQDYSDSLKGDHSMNTSAQKGFLQGSSDTEIRKAGAGQASFFSGAKVDQFINYLDNHDNLTLFDKILASNGTSGYTPGKDGKTSAGQSLYDTNKNAVNNPSAQVLGQMKLAITSALTSQGIPFTVAGTEFCRTKYGDANSYRTPDQVNAIDWNRAEKYAAVADYYAGLIAIRRAFDAFTDSTSNATTTVSGCTAWQITNSKSGQWNKIIVALNNTSSAKSISLSGSWVVVANGTKSGTTSLGNASGSYSVPAWSGVVLVDAGSFNNYSQPNPGVASVTTEHYTRDAETGSYTKVLTETAKYKEGQTWRASKNLSILFDHKYDKVESTVSGKTYGSVTAGASITVKFYYTRTVKSGILTVNFKDTANNAKVKTSMKYRLRDGDPFSIPATAVLGYEVDTSKYPAKTVGTFDADHPAVFDFYYKKLANNTTRVHYYKPGTKFANTTATILCYAYDDNGNEPLGDWPSQTKSTAGMKADTTMGNGWVYIDIPATSCYVMFHTTNPVLQVPGQGEKGYVCSGEAWIKDGIVSFNNKIVTSHIELETGAQLADDVVKQYTNVSSNTIYTTSADKELKKKREVISPANASGFYESGVTNVVYLYSKEKEEPDPGPGPGPGPGPEPGEGMLMGDADKNESIEILDATFIQRVLAALETEDAVSKKLSDVNQNNHTDIIDATFIQRWLANIPTDNSVVGQRVSVDDIDDPVEDELAFTDFVEMYNNLSIELAKYPERTYGSDPHYLAAAAALSTYRTLSMSGSAEPEEIKEAYDACKAALEGLDEIEEAPGPGPGPNPGDPVTIYFSNNKYWTSVCAYVWGTSGEGVWPGEPLTSIGTNSFGQDIYSVTVYSGDSVIFNGAEGQTVDIAVDSMTQNAVYCLEDTDVEGHYLYGEWTYTEGGDEPGPGPVDPSGSKMYMTPSSEWKQAGARFAAYFFEGSSYVWVNMKYAGEDLYSVDIPNGYSNVIFVRMNGSTTENNWENKWNQTADLTVEPNTTYTVNGWEQ